MSLDIIKINWKLSSSVLSTKCAFPALPNLRGINHHIINIIIIIIIIIKGTHKNKWRKPPSCFCKNGGIGHAFYFKLVFILTKFARPFLRVSSAPANHILWETTDPWRNNDTLMKSNMAAPPSWILVRRHYWWRDPIYGVILYPHTILEPNPWILGKVMAIFSKIHVDGRSPFLN